MKPRIAAFDLGKHNTGYALDLDGDIVTGHKSFSNCQTHGEIFRCFDYWLHVELFCRTMPWDLVALFQSHLFGGATTFILIGMQSHVLRQCDEHEIRVEIYNDSAVKKWATGNGRADKEAMMLAYRERRGCDPLSHDEADAYLLMEYAHEKLKAGAG